MKQRDLDRLRIGIDPELQDLVGDADELDVDSGSLTQSDDPVLELITDVAPARSTTKRSVHDEFKDLLGIPSGDGLSVDDDETASTISQAEFLKSDSPEFPFAVPSPVETGTEKSQRYRTAQDRFIKSLRWIRDRANAAASPEDKEQGVVENVWEGLFGFSSEKLNNDSDAREAVGQLVTNLVERELELA